jgi:hypothetical protein
MRTSSWLVPILLLTMAPTLASAAAAVPGAADDLALRFVVDEQPNGGTEDRALVDVGPLSAAWTGAGRSRSASAITVQRRVGLRVSSRSGRRGFVQVRASLAGPEMAGTVTIDGIALTAAPRIVDAQAPIGSTVGHLVEIAIPASAPQGAFTAEIVWEVEEP